MAIAYYGTDISPNQTETTEGYLICRNVPIARTGQQEYMARELLLDGDPERIVLVDRMPEDVFEEATLASFEGKPVTDGHPPENVSPENFSAYAKGHVQNVRRAGDFIMADLYITDPNLASEVRNGVKREVSCGYLCNYDPHGDGYKQSHIRGNHVAVVPRGRAGHDVAIQDAATEKKAEKGRKNMSKFTTGILSILGMAARDAEPEEMKDIVDAAAAALEAVPAEKAPEADPAAKDVMVERAPKGDDLGSKLDRVIEMLASLEKKNDREEKMERKMSDEEDLDDMIEKLAGEKEDKEAAVTVPAEEMEDMNPMDKEAAARMLKKVRPAVAAIENKKDRARVVDALLSTIRGNGMENIMKAAQDHAAKAAYASNRTSYEKACADAQEAYAARNPHKNKEA